MPEHVGIAGRRARSCAGFIRQIAAFPEALHVGADAREILDQGRSVRSTPRGILSVLSSRGVIANVRPRFHERLPAAHVPRLTDCRCKRRADRTRRTRGQRGASHEPALSHRITYFPKRQPAEISSSISRSRWTASRPPLRALAHGDLCLPLSVAAAPRSTAHSLSRIGS